MMPLSSLPAMHAAIAACAIGPAFGQAAPSPEDLYRQLSPSIWLVRVYDADGLAAGTGSAVVTGHETLLTNCHVLRKSKRITILNDNVQHEARLQHLDIDRDLCQITARNMRAPAVALGDSDRLAVGQKVYALGNPQGLERTLSDGLVSALRRKEDTRELQLVQTTAPISPGSSGGGLFDAQGRLVGITTLQLKESQNLNFAIPINWLRDLPARSDAALQAANAARAPAASAGSYRTGVDVADVSAIPVNDLCREEYRKFVLAPAPKAFAISSSGKCAWQQSRKPNRPQVTNSPDPAVRAMELCVHWHGTGCALYAVDSAVVYKR
jgi:serine protease Do